MHAISASSTPTARRCGKNCYGLTKVLDTYWQVQNTDFPYPSMVGAGDHMSICWAVLGQAPSLAAGVPLPESGVLYHACQGMHLEDPASSSCAALAVYHTCRGSNGCHAQGGCGFAQLDSGGGQCDGSAAPSSCGHSAKVTAVYPQLLAELAKARAAERGEFAADAVVVSSGNVLSTPLGFHLEASHAA